MKPLLALILLGRPLGAQPPAGYRLAWREDFSGAALDASRRMYRTDVKMDSSPRAENV
jgi:hypothetical protein